MEIALKNGDILTLYSREAKDLVIKNDAHEHNEAKHQVFEGLSYDYEFSKENLSFKDHQLVKPHSSKKYLGRIEPNIYVGTLELEILENGKFLEIIALEVQSVKASYREDYRFMLEEITTICTDLLMQVDSPVTQSFEVDFDKDSETLYQRFSFLKSILDTDDFRESVQKIISNPVTQWNEFEEEVDVRRIRRFSNKNVKNLLKSSNQIPLPKQHQLRSVGLNTIAHRIPTLKKIDSVDTPENRFVKYALEYFLHFIVQIKDIARKTEKKRLKNEALLLENELDFHLSHALFKDVSSPKTLPLSSPALQRREGYREILRVWLMIDMPAKLVWKGGDDVYKAGKKDVATLYEYWLFFMLHDLFSDLFKIDFKGNNLIKLSDNGLSLRLKQGKRLSSKGVYSTGKRKLNIKFSYNRTFSANSNYSKSGSWTTRMRPDYTLTIWPCFIKEDGEDYKESDAEKEENLIHIHFDAKYKVENFTDIIPETSTDDEKLLDEEKEENLKGRYKNADLLKMHAYKDAIRRTSGAYVLYPGDVSKELAGFHEIQPGLGAFAIRPSKSNNGIPELRDFIKKVISHLENRISQQEQIAYHTYHTYKTEQPTIKAPFISESLAEYPRENNELHDGTLVLFGYVKSKGHFQFYKKRKFYNFRVDDKSNRFLIDSDMARAKYIALRYNGRLHLHNIIGNPEIVSKQLLINLGYQNPSKEAYIIMRIGDKEVDKFGNVSDVDFTQLPEYQKIFGNRNLSRSDKGAPFAAKLINLLALTKANS